MVEKTRAKVYFQVNLRIGSQEEDEPKSMAEQQAPRRTLLDSTSPMGSIRQTNVNINIGDGVTFKYNNALINSLPTFDGSPIHDPIEFLDTYHMALSTQNIPGISLDVLKMMYFHLTLKQRAKDWYRSLGVTFNNWNEMQNRFLSKFFPISKTIALRKEISNFQPMDEEAFSESWERFKGLIRRCPHHGFENSRLAQHFYESKNDDNPHKADLAAGGSFYAAYEDEIFDLLEKVAENVLQQTTRSNPKRGVFHVSSLETGLKETNKKLDNIATALEKVLQLKSPLIKARICSLCYRSDHEDGACQEEEYEEAQVHMVGQLGQWSGQRNQGNFKQGFRFGFQPKSSFQYQAAPQFQYHPQAPFPGQEHSLSPVQQQQAVPLQNRQQNSPQSLMQNYNPLDFSPMVTMLNAMQAQMQAQIQAQIQAQVQALMKEKMAEGMKMQPQLPHQGQGQGQRQFEVGQSSQTKGGGNGPPAQGKILSQPCINPRNISCIETRTISVPTHGNFTSLSSPMSSFNKSVCSNIESLSQYPLDNPLISLPINFTSGNLGNSSSTTVDNTLLPHQEASVSLPIPTDLAQAHAVKKSMISDPHERVRERKVTYYSSAEEEDHGESEKEEELEEKRGSSEKEGKLEQNREKEQVPSNYSPSLPFPKALGRLKPLLDGNPLLHSFKDTTVTIPLEDAIKYIPTFTKYVKDLVTLPRKKN